jgi:transcriptional regulator with XRE-family HTH domain
MNTAAFRALLRRYRDARLLSQMALGRRADLDYTMISRLERGDREPTVETIAKLVAGLALEEPAADLLYLSAGYVPSDLTGPHEHDATLLRAWRALRRPLGNTDALAKVIDYALALAEGEASAGEGG